MGRGKKGKGTPATKKQKDAMSRLLMRKTAKLTENEVKITTQTILNLRKFLT